MSCSGKVFLPSMTYILAEVAQIIKSICAVRLLVYKGFIFGVGNSSKKNKKEC